MLLAACRFAPGSGMDQPQDDAPPPGIDGAIDAPRSDSMVIMADAAVDGPFTSTCSGIGLTCAGSVVAVMCNGGCWAKCTSSVAIVNQAAAAGACATWGGELAPIRNQGDQDCVANTLFPQQAPWIGFEQSGTATTLTTGWTWNSDGIAPVYTHWGSGQPNDSNGNENDHAEQCAFMNTAGDWHDTSCGDGGLFRFSCRR